MCRLEKEELAGFGSESDTLGWDHLDFASSPTICLDYPHKYLSRVFEIFPVKEYHKWYDLSGRRIAHAVLSCSAALDISDLRSFDGGV